MGGRRGPNEILSLRESAVTPIGDAVTISDIEVFKPHCFAGVQFFSDAAGTTPAVAGAGTVVIKIQTVNTVPAFESIPDGVITAAAPTTLSWAANTLKVKAIPAGLTVATHYKLVVTCNET